MLPEGIHADGNTAVMKSNVTANGAVIREGDIICPHITLLSSAETQMIFSFVKRRKIRVISVVNHQCVRAHVG